MPFEKLFSFQTLYKYYNTVPGTNLYVNALFIIMSTKNTLLEGQRKTRLQDIKR